MAFRRCAWQAFTPPHDVGLVATLAKVYPEAKACCFRLSSLPCGMSHLAPAEREVFRNVVPSPATTLHLIAVAG
jgi:hypothetical protein